MTKIVQEGKFIRERIEAPSSLRRRGFGRFRTKKVGAHRIILACKGPRTKRGGCRVASILHPLSEGKGPRKEFFCRNMTCKRIKAGALGGRARG